MNIATNGLATYATDCYAQIMQLDTLTIASRLKEAGLAPKVAEEWAAIWHQSVTEGLASKEDITMLHTEIGRVRKEVVSVKNELNTKIESLEERLDSKIDNLEERMNLKFDTLQKDLTLQMWKMAAVVVGILLAAIKYL